MEISRVFVKEKLLSYLSKSENTRGMLRLKITNYLAKKSGDFALTKIELEQADLDGVLDELENLGYLSDERFCEIYCRVKSEQGYGRKYILQKLLQKGVNKELASQALSDTKPASEDKKERLEEIRIRKFGVELPTDFKEKNRQIRYLLSKGYDMDDILDLFR